MPRSREGYLWTPSSSTDGLTTAAVVSTTIELKPHYDVIVIGAGFAGLTAARELAQLHHKSVLILEGRDRIGGRTWTANALGEDFEMGGTWVHWTQPHVFAELHRYGMHKNLKTSAGSLEPLYTDYKPANADMLHVSSQECAEHIQNVANRFFELDGKSSRELMPYPHDQLREPAPWKNYDHLTVQDRLNDLKDVPTLHKDLFECLLNTFGCSPVSALGFVEALRWYALSGHSMAGIFEMAGVYKIGKGGMTSLARAIFKDAGSDIVLDTVIHEIDQRGPEAVTVRSKDGRTFAAPAVISTVPLNCLGDVTFTPPLSPLRSEAIQQGHITKGAKIHFKLAQTEAAWSTMCNSAGDSAFCFAFSDHNGTGDSGPKGTYCIGFGYSGALPDPQDSKTIIAEFQRNIRPGAEVEVQAYLTHDWVADPLAKGTWCCFGPTAMSKYLHELQKRHGNVLFASADWSDGYRGFVDGAIASGKEAAREAMVSLKAAKDGTVVS